MVLLVVSLGSIGAARVVPNAYRGMGQSYVGEIARGMNTWGSQTVFAAGPNARAHARC